eukprot:CAMPEP_0173390838 /NCGR_PEP_ID=MMETSP1356-20130122/16330_1 /TAXON_ID=77927 ORGANISM="Hemiselmis virescens, Strain PCC157" /NCGR_SAMPLE_ID=MMETSP1356 /ASSEMBLY_ACC=CAM_ASM_000847 /LENGTH=345 /DNA_ID=CAMNT_0014348321 /DNA_START=158 /DNA_END=1195 /DNA_ORIENTATION=+
MELDLGTQSPLRDVDQASLTDAENIVCKTIGTVKEGDLKVETHQLPGADFSSAHSASETSSWWDKPLVVQLFFSADQTKVFVRTMLSLEVVDGVGALHATFNVVEYLENRGKGLKPEEYLSVPRFKSANKPIGFDPEKMAAHEKRLEGYSASFDASRKEANGKLPVGPPRCSDEEHLKPRVWTRWSDVTTPFKEFMGIAAEVQKRLEFEYIFYTVNYSPGVGMGVLPGVMDTLDHQKRTEGVFTPVGPPLPMNTAHAENLSYGMLWNNYGRHEPKFSAQVKGLVWNWTGMPKSFVPSFHCATIQGKSFVSSTFAEQDQRACAELLDKIGGRREVFTECPRPLPTR